MSKDPVGDIFRDPVKMQQFKLQHLLIKEQKERWKFTAVGWIIGLLTAIVPVIVMELTRPVPAETNEPALLQVVRDLEGSIHRLEAGNTILKDRVQTLENSLKQK